MNFCTWERRHSTGCGHVKVTSVDTGLVAVVPVVDFGDLYTGTPDERMVDLQYDVLALLGLDPARGLYAVTVQPFREGASSSTLLPDTAYNVDAEVAAQSHRLESRAARSGELPLTGRASARTTGGRP